MPGPPGSHDAAGAARSRAALALAGLTSAYAAAAWLAVARLGARPDNPWFVFTMMICFLGWCATARPLYLPRVPSPLRSIRPWEQRGGAYHRLGVRAAGALIRRTPLRALNRDVYAARHGIDSPTLAAQVEAAEAAHLWDAVLVVPYLVLAGIRREWAVVAWFTAAQLAVNVYPVLHLRMTRARLVRVGARLARSAGGPRRREPSCATDARPPAART